MYTVGTEGRGNKQFLVGELRPHKPHGMAKKKKKKIQLRLQGHQGEFSEM